MTRLAVPAIALLLGASLPAASPPAGAQNLDMSQGGPVDVTATDGIEWRQQEQVVVARGNARAIRGNVTVEGDRLIARYRPRAGSAPQSQPGQGETPGGSNEIFRLEAEGDVRIYTATDTGRGNRAVYDMDQAVLVLTGQAPSLTTPRQVITARQSLEYWSQRRMAVARGNALVVEPELSRRVGADTLVAYFVEEQQGAPPRPNPCGTAAPAPARPASGYGVAPSPNSPAARGTQQPAATTASPPPGAGRVDRVEAFGHVEIRTAEEVVRGDRGVYSPETGMARILDNVRITRGENQINGREAIVNLCTGVARLVSRPGDRVQGLLVPNSEQQQGGQQGGQQATPPTGTQPARRTP